MRVITVRTRLVRYNNRLNSIEFVKCGAIRSLGPRIRRKMRIYVCLVGIGRVRNSDVSSGVLPSCPRRLIYYIIIIIMALPYKNTVSCGTERRRSQFVEGGEEWGLRGNYSAPFVQRSTCPGRNNMSIKGDQSPSSGISCN